MVQSTSLRLLCIFFSPGKQKRGASGAGGVQAFVTEAQLVALCFQFLRYSKVNQLYIHTAPQRPLTQPRPVFWAHPQASLVAQTVKSLPAKRETRV